MPVATSSRRRKTARQASSDIEEDQPTQKGRAQDDEVDEDDEDDAPPTRPVKKEKAAVKKEKGTAKSQPRREDPEDDEEDEDDRIDIDNFADQALTKADGAKIVGFCKDWNSIEETMHQPSPIISRVASAMAEVAGEEAQEGLAELDRIMKGLLDAQALMTGHSKVLSDIIQSVARGEELTNATDKYMELVDEMNAEYDSKTTRQKYMKNEQYVAFKEAIYEVDHSGHAMPPITDFIPREDGDESDDDDDVVMGGITQEYKCPLLMTLLVDPRTSSVCKHSFSGAAIQDMFKNTRGSLKCPAAGCSKSFTLADCKPNPDLARKVKAHERRQARQQQDSDAEEVID
ncbi:hypothetical protein B0H17DRAFT_1008113 [Mycena rosella]|uniref:SP-RING-type domain-containing protein n=1 Tax=Mycena rosella TaxID=1033263 RepID=A0AAD7DP33_MYCRO|nr:hypothetical protein B0H17DRAFT_1008113 [Mycena rosella]